MKEKDKKYGTGEKEIINKERESILDQWEKWFDLPLIILSLVWLILLLIEFLGELTPFLSVLVYVIWIIFGIDFLVRFLLAPVKLIYLRKNILVVISLLLPAFRIFRVTGALRLLFAVRAGRGLRLLQIFTSTNRGMRALGKSFGKRGFGYVLAITLIMMISGAVGVYYFERPGLPDFGAALWWSAMIITTMGSGYWPVTPEGRMLTFLLAIFSFSIFGYITAIITAFFMGGEVRSQAREKTLKKEMAAIREELKALKEALNQEQKNTP